MPPLLDGSEPPTAGSVAALSNPTVLCENEGPIGTLSLASSLVNLGQQKGAKHFPTSGQNCFLGSQREWTEGQSAFPHKINANQHFVIEMATVPRRSRILLCYQFPAVPESDRALSVLISLSSSLFCSCRCLLGPPGSQQFASKGGVYE